MNRRMNKPETPTGKAENKKRQPENVEEYVEKLEKKVNRLEKQLNKRESKAEKIKRGVDVNGGLRKFNMWLDEFILEAAKPFALIGFAMGTIDIFLRGDIATQVWFNVPWSAVQAVSIDGLFFSVWYKLFSAHWTWKTALGNTGLFLAGVVLAGMVIVTNGITSLQQLWNLPDSQSAMERIGIPVELFTLVRATLIVVVAVMIAFVYYRKSSPAQTEHTSVQDGISGEQPKVQIGNSTVQNGNTEFRIEQIGVQTGQTGIPPAPTEIPGEPTGMQTGIQSVQSERTGIPVQRTEQSGNSTRVREVQLEIPQLPPGNEERTRLTKEGLLEMWAETGGKVNIPKLAAQSGIGKTTLYGWLKEIKKERACLVPAR